MDERALARALADGDGDAFRVLVDQQTPSVFRICHRILGSVEEAEDAAQEAFVLAYRALATYRGDGPPGAWLARIATRECWVRAARQARRTNITGAIDDTLASTLVDASDPAVEAVVAERRAAVRDAVAALPEPYREVVTLRFFGDLSLADIALTTGRPQGTIKAQLHRGLERLRRRAHGMTP